MPKIAKKIDPIECESAFRGVRHFSPETIRNLRSALDNGIKPEKLKRLAKGDSPDVAMVHLAIDHMTTNPDAGAVIWDGMRYSWAKD